MGSRAGPNVMIGLGLTLASYHRRLRRVGAYGFPSSLRLARVPYLMLDEILDDGSGPEHEGCLGDLRGVGVRAGFRGRRLSPQRGVRGRRGLSGTMVEAASAERGAPIAEAGI